MEGQRRCAVSILQQRLDKVDDSSEFRGSYGALVLLPTAAAALIVLVWDCGWCRQPLFLSRALLPLSTILLGGQYSTRTQYQAVALLTNCDDDWYRYCHPHALFPGEQRGMGWGGPVTACPGAPAAAWEAY